MKRLIAALLFMLPSTAWATCSSVPYTFTPNTLIQSGQVNANFAAVVNCANTIDASQITTGVLPVARGGTNNPTWTTGSVVFATAPTQLGQDNANLFWDSTNLRLGVKTNTPVQPLEVNGGARFDGQVVANGASGGFFVNDQTTSGVGGFFRTGGINLLWDSAAGNTIEYDSAGHVSIDTTPNASYALNVNGGLNASGIAATTGNIGGVVLSGSGISASGGGSIGGVTLSGGNAVLSGASIQIGGLAVSDLGSGIMSLSLAAGSPGVHAQAGNYSGTAVTTAGSATACWVTGQYIASQPGLTVCASDARLKDIGDSLSDGLSLVDQLKPVNFVWKDGVDKHPKADDGLHAGFVAQDVLKIMPACVDKHPDDFYGLDSNCLIAYLVKAIQELDAKVSTK